MCNSMVSIVIPTYKRPAMLHRTIESVLRQTYSNIEVIVVDDNDAESSSRKETEELMQRYGTHPNVIYLQHLVNRNGSAARNTGIRAARGEYIAFLDDDDEFLPDKLEKQVKRIEELNDNEFGGVYCNYERLTNGELVYRTAHRYKKDEGDLTADMLMERNEIGAGSTLMIKKKVAHELQGFDETFHRHQDWEFMLRFFKKYKLAICQEILVKVNNEDNTNKQTPEKMLRIKEQYLEHFQTDIQKFEPQIQNRIYARHWLVVSEGFYQAGDRKSGQKYAKKAMQYKVLPLKAKVKLYAYQLNIFRLINSIFTFSRKYIFN